MKTIRRKFYDKKGKLLGEKEVESSRGHSNYEDFAGEKFKLHSFDTENGVVWANYVKTNVITRN